MAANGFDYDWLIVGSGFGGSVSALRLVEKGYRVGVLECGRRYRDEDYAATTWDLRRFLWAPALGLHGIMRLTAFKDIFIASGSAVGGGSAVYACTLYRANPQFFRNPQWADLYDWAQKLRPHYDTAERMLGVSKVSFESAGQKLAKEVATHFGVADTFTPTPVGIYFGEPGKTVPDPYFGGAGPARAGCTRCGACVVGCRVGAKNTLLKNYLWFAEKKGAQVFADQEVVDIVPLAAADGSDGYRIVTERPGAWFRKHRRTFTARGVILAAGALGTNRLLAKCKHGGSLPHLSDRLGQLVRTNSESICAVRLPDDKLDTSNDISLSSSIHMGPDTHIEFVTYGPKGDFMSTNFTLLTGNGSRFTRPLMLLGNIVRNPLRFVKSQWPVGWGRRTVIMATMQTLDNAISFRAKRRWFGGIKLVTQQDPLRPNPTFIEAGYLAARWLAEHTGGTAQGMTLESVANIPSTAHILGGAVIGRDGTTGVVDRHNRVFGYENLLICDGSTMPANPGVNPSLTITAMAEHAMTHIPPAQSTVGDYDPLAMPDSNLRQVTT
jgi:cholesterol oxidase